MKKTQPIKKRPMKAMREALVQTWLGQKVKLPVVPVPIVPVVIPKTVPK